MNKYILLTMYVKYFSHTTDIDKYLEVIACDLNDNYSMRKINFFAKCVDDNIDVVALEYNLRKKDKNNIFSFAFLRLSALAESTVENQYRFINNRKINIFRIIIFLAVAVINLILLEMKGVIMKRRIKEYLDV